MRLSLRRTVGLLCITLPRTVSMSTGRGAQSTGIASPSMVTATDLFSAWAREGRDEKMESGHSLAVLEMLKKSRQYFPHNYNFLDIGCGNGWVVRAEAQQEDCKAAAGVDGAKDMIIKANNLNLNSNSKSASSSCTFHHSDLLAFQPTHKYDVAFSMEVMYYLSDTEVASMLSVLSNKIVEKNGIFVMGIDHYLENEDCHSWSSLHNTPMLLWSEQRWLDEIQKAGFEVLHQWRSGKREHNPEGTMSIVARNSRTSTSRDGSGSGGVAESLVCEE